MRLPADFIELTGPWPLRCLFPHRSLTTGVAAPRPAPSMAPLAKLCPINGAARPPVTTPSAAPFAALRITGCRWKKPEATNGVPPNSALTEAALGRQSWLPMPIVTKQSNVMCFVKTVLVRFVANTGVAFRSYLSHCNSCQALTVRLVDDRCANIHWDGFREPRSGATYKHGVHARRATPNQSRAETAAS